MMNLGHDDWRWMLASSAIPALLILLLRFGTPESPRWLLSKGRADEAQAVLKQMLGPDATLAELEPRTAPKRYVTIFRGAEYRRRTLFVACSGPASCCRSTRSPPTSPRSWSLRTGRRQRRLSRRGDGADLLRPRVAVRSWCSSTGRRTLLLWSFGISALPLIGLPCWPTPDLAGDAAVRVFGVALVLQASASRPSIPPSCSRPGCAPPPTASPPAQAESVRRSGSTARPTCSTTGAADHARRRGRGSPGLVGPTLWHPRPTATRPPNPVP